MCQVVFMATIQVVVPLSSLAITSFYLFQIGHLLYQLGMRIDNDSNFLFETL